jgi:hypothetical protein
MKLAQEFTLSDYKIEETNLDVFGWLARRRQLLINTRSCLRSMYPGYLHQQ